MDDKKVVVSVRISTSDNEAVRALSKESGLRIAWIWSKAIKDYLQARYDEGWAPKSARKARAAK